MPFSFAPAWVVTARLSRDSVANQQPSSNPAWFYWLRIRPPQFFPSLLQCLCHADFSVDWFWAQAAPVGSEDWALRNNSLIIWPTIWPKHSMWPQLCAVPKSVRKMTSLVPSEVRFFLSGAILCHVTVTKAKSSLTGQFGSSVEGTLW